MDTTPQSAPSTSTAPPTRHATPQPTLLDRVLAHLERHGTINLATSGPEGLWAAAVLYVNDGTTLYFATKATTRHGRNLLSTRRVAGTINDDAHELGEIKGVQLSAAVLPIEDEPTRRRVVAAYLEKFPTAAKLWRGSSAEQIAKDPGVYNFYKVVPTRLYFVDNEHSPGRREELPLD